MTAARALAAVAIAASILAPAGTASPRPRSFFVRSVTVAVTNHDVGPKGPSVGDSSTTRDRLINPVAQFGKPAGAVVGSDEGRAVATGPASASVTGTVVLPGGTLRIDGPLRPSSGGGAVMPIVGGTGVFAHAHGTVTIVGTGTRPLNHYVLSYGH